MEKKLFRNEHDKMIAGVASGLADYLEIDVVIVRLLFLLASIFMAGTGLVAYIILWIVVPVNNDPAARFSKFNDYFNKKNPPASPFNPSGTGNATNWANPLSDAPKAPFEPQNAFVKPKGSPDTGRIVGGLLLLFIGCFFLMQKLDFIPDWVRLRNLWPIIFIVGGLSLVIKSKRKNEWERWQSQQDTELKNESVTETAGEVIKQEDSSTETKI